LINNITSNPRIRRGVYIFLGLLTLIMVALSFIELWVLSNTSDMTAYGSVEADSNGYPANDQRGAFVILKDNHNPLYRGNLIELLATTEPGVVDTAQGAHLVSTEIQSLLVQSSALNDPGDYRVYRIGDPNSEPMTYDRRPGGKDLVIMPKSGQWPPGAYMVDIPADGMFGGRTYYQFFVDPEQ
jgi:hypothetical protein